MAGNTFGHIFRLTTFGESHGSAIGGVIDGCPPGMVIDTDWIDKQMKRRRPGQSRYVSQRREEDKVTILSGVFAGKTTGTPIAFTIDNQDQRTKDYTHLANVYRPGHADYTYEKKYGIRDYRGGGRSSARETAVRVAAGAIARQYLKRQGIEIVAYICQIGEHRIHRVDYDYIDKNPFFCPDSQLVPKLEDYMQKLIKAGDSIGALIEVRVTGVPVGLGEPVFDRLDADIAKALMSINAVKAVEVGDGFAVVEQRGSDHRDEMDSSGFLSNHAGGILGGISSGQDLIMRLAVKPTSSIRLPAQSINSAEKPTTVIVTGRHDPCVGIRAVPIAEAMVGLVLIDSLLRHRAYCSK